MRSKKGIILLTMSVVLIGGGGYFAYANGKLDKIAQMLGISSETTNIFEQINEKKTKATKDETINNIAYTFESITKMKKGTLDLGINVSGVEEGNKINFNGNARIVNGEKQKEISLTKIGEKADLLFGVKVDSETGNGIIDFRGVKDLNELIQKIKIKDVQPIKELGTTVGLNITDEKIEIATEGVKEISKTVIDGLTTEDGKLLHYYTVEGLGEFITDDEEVEVDEEEKMRMFSMIKTFLSPYPETQIRNNVIMLNLKELHLGLDALLTSEEYKEEGQELLIELGIDEEEYNKNKEKTVQEALQLEKLDNAVLKIAVGDVKNGNRTLGMQIYAVEGENNGIATVYVNTSEQELFLIDEAELGDNKLTDEKITEITESLSTIVQNYMNKLSNGTNAEETVEQAMENEGVNSIEKVEDSESIIVEEKDEKDSLDVFEEIMNEDEVDEFSEELYYSLDDEYLKNAPSFLKGKTINEVYSGLVEQTAWNIDTDFVAEDGIRYINYSLNDVSIHPNEAYETKITGTIQVYVDKEGNPQPNMIKYSLKVINLEDNWEDEYSLEIKTKWENGEMKEERIEN